MEARACPCVHTTPCHDRCTCVMPFSSSGCRRCCTYGSAEQQRAKAQHLATLIDDDDGAALRGDGAVKTFAKKRESICAVQWTGEMTPEIVKLLGDRLISAAEDELAFANAKGPGRFARKGDWIASASGEDLFVIGDVQFRKIYEEVDEGFSAFGIVANGGPFQVLSPPHVVDGYETIAEPIYVTRESDLRRAIAYAAEQNQRKEQSP